MGGEGKCTHSKTKITTHSSNGHNIKLSRDKKTHQTIIPSFKMNQMKYKKLIATYTE